MMSEKRNNLEGDATSIKFQFNGDIRRVKVSSKISYTEVLELITSLFKIQSDLIQMKYKDNENDLCTICSEQELREAFIAKKDNELLRLELSNLPKHFQNNKLQKPVILLDPIQPNQSVKEPRKCWPERINHRRMQLQGLHEEAFGLMEAKNYEEAKALFVKQAEAIKCPWKKSTPLYNIACCESLLGNIDSALSFLSQAIANGFRNVQHIEQDVDLISLRGLEAYELMISELKESPQPKRARTGWRGGWGCQQNQEREIKHEIREASPLVIRSPSRPTVPSPEIVPAESEFISFAETTPSTLQSDTFITVADKPAEFPAEEIKAEIKPEIQVEAVPEELPAHKKFFSAEFQSELASLQAMGFTDVPKNLACLRKAKGNLSEAVVLLLS